MIARIQMLILHAADTYKTGGDPLTVAWMRKNEVTQSERAEIKEFIAAAIYEKAALDKKESL